MKMVCCNQFNILYNTTNFLKYKENAVGNIIENKLVPYYYTNIILY